MSGLELWWNNSNEEANSSLWTNESIDKQKSLLDSIQDPDNKKILLEEYEEFKKWVEEINFNTSWALEDLKQEFEEDIEAIKNMDKLYSDLIWYKEFKTILASNELKQELEEKVFEVIWDEENKWLIRDFVGFEFNWEFFPDKEWIEDFIDSYEKEYQIEDIKPVIQSSDTLSQNSNEISQDSNKVSQNDGTLSQNDSTLSQNDSTLSQNDEKVFTNNTEVVNKTQEIDKKINSVKNLIKDYTLKTIIDEYENSETVEEKLLKAKEISDYLNKQWVLEKILEEAKKWWKENYNDVYNFIKTIAEKTDNYILLQKLENYSFSTKTDSTLRNWQIETFMSDENNLKDQFVDTKKTPPKAYIVNRNSWYKVEVDLIKTPPELTDLRRKYQNKKIEIKKEWKTMNDELNSLIDKYEEASENEKTIIMEKIKEKREEIKVLKKQAKELEEEFKNRLEDYTEQMKRIQEEENEKAREIRDFLEEIGFDLIDMNITNNIIEQLNYEDSLRVNLWFNQKINIKEGQLGFENINSDDLLSNQEKVVFAKVVNKMITGSTKWPIDINAIKNWTWVAIPDKEEFSFILEQKWIRWLNWNAIAMENLRKENNEKE